MNLRKKDLVKGKELPIYRDHTDLSTEIGKGVLLDLVEDGLPFYLNSNVTDHKLETWNYQVWRCNVQLNDGGTITRKFKIPYLDIAAGGRIRSSNPPSKIDINEMSSEEVENLSEEAYIKLCKGPIDNFMSLEGQQLF